MAQPTAGIAASFLAAVFEGVAWHWKLDLTLWRWPVEIGLVGLAAFAGAWWHQLKQTERLEDLLHAKPRVRLSVVSEGSFLLIDVRNEGGQARVTGRITLPNRLPVRTALWHHGSARDEYELPRGTSARFRIARRERPPAEDEDAPTRFEHGGPQSWRVLYASGGRAFDETVCAVDNLRLPLEDRFIEISVFTNPELTSGTETKRVYFDGARAYDADTEQYFQVEDSERQYPLSGGRTRRIELD